MEALIIGTLMTLMNLGIQVKAVDILIKFFSNHLRAGRQGAVQMSGWRIISIVMLVLFTGHLVQFATWAILFMGVGEFSDFTTAFYHSTVNFASLGYGDIVMSEDWRLLGALEAANGVMMFGLSAGTILAVMMKMLERDHAGTLSD